MSAASKPPVPNLVRDALERDGAYDFGLGVVLRAPTNSSGSGGSASYRLEYRVEPVLPGRPLSRGPETVVMAGKNWKLRVPLIPGG